MRADSHSIVKGSGSAAKVILLVSAMIFCTCACAVADPSSLLVEKVGPWGLFCEKEIRAPDDCAIAQASTDPETQRTLSASFVFRPDGNVTMRVKSGPIYGDLKRVSLLVNGEQTGFTYASCEDDRCKAVVTILKPYLSTMLEAKDFGFETKTDERNGVLVTLNATSFRKAFEEMHKRVTEKVRLGPNDLWGGVPPSVANNEQGKDTTKRRLYKCVASNGSPGQLNDSSGSRACYNVPLNLDVPNFQR